MLIIHRVHGYTEISRIYHASTAERVVSPLRYSRRRAWQPLTPIVLRVRVQVQSQVRSRPGGLVAQLEEAQRERELTAATPFVAAALVLPLTAIELASVPSPLPLSGSLHPRLSLPLLTQIPQTPNSKSSSRHNRQILRRSPRPTAPPKHVRSALCEIRGGTV